MNYALKILVMYVLLCNLVLSQSHDSVKNLVKLLYPKELIYEGMGKEYDKSGEYSFDVDKIVSFRDVHEYYLRAPKKGLHGGGKMAMDIPFDSPWNWALRNNLASKKIFAEKDKLIREIIVISNGISGETLLTDEHLRRLWDSYLVFDNYAHACEDITAEESESLLRKWRELIAFNAKDFTQETTTSLIARSISGSDAFKDKLLYYFENSIEIGNPENSFHSISFLGSSIFRSYLYCPNEKDALMIKSGTLKNLPTGTVTILVRRTLLPVNKDFHLKEGALEELLVRSFPYGESNQNVYIDTDDFRGTNIHHYKVGGNSGQLKAINIDEPVYVGFRSEVPDPDNGLSTRRVSNRFNCYECHTSQKSGYRGIFSLKENSLEGKLIKVSDLLWSRK